MVINTTKEAHNPKIKTAKIPSANLKRTDAFRGHAKLPKHDYRATFR
jgi:hypothetical protein